MTLAGTCGIRRAEDFPLDAQSVNAAIDADPFRGVALRLTDGSRVTLPCAYLSFVLRDSLYAAEVVREGQPRESGRVALIPLTEIAGVESARSGMG